jgi:SAM-dependent methyltransferase
VSGQPDFILTAKESSEFFEDWYESRRRSPPANWFASYYRTNTENPRRLLAQVLKNARPNIFLDIGCGDGGHTLLAKSLYQDMETVGIDLSVRALEMARRQFYTQRIPCNLIRCDAQHAPFRNNSIDMVMMIGILHHIGNSFPVMEALRILVPGGNILIEEVTFNPLGYILQRLFGLLPDNPRRRIAEAGAGVPRINIITRSLLRRWLSAFEIINEECAWLFLFVLLYVMEFSGKMTGASGRSWRGPLLALFRAERLLIGKTPARNFSRFTAIWGKKPASGVKVRASIRNSDKCIPQIC